jgi:hypothetical protein
MPRITVDASLARAREGAPPGAGGTRKPARHAGWRFLVEEFPFALALDRRIN